MGKFIFFVDSDYSISNATALEMVLSNGSYLVNLDRYELHRDNIVRNHEKRDSDYFLGEFYKYYGRTTTLLPLTKERFDLTIDNALFDVYVNRSNLQKRLEYTVIYETKTNVYGNFDYTLTFGKIRNFLNELPISCSSNRFKSQLQIKFSIFHFFLFQFGPQERT